MRDFLQSTDRKMTTFVIHYLYFLKKTHVNYPYALQNTSFQEDLETSTIKRQSTLNIEMILALTVLKQRATKSHRLQDDSTAPFIETNNDYQD